MNHMQKLLYFIKCVGGNYLLLELAVLTSFFGFTLNPGALGEFMRIAGSIFFFQCDSRKLPIKAAYPGPYHFFYSLYASAGDPFFSAGCHSSPSFRSLFFSIPLADHGDSLSSYQTVDGRTQTT